MTPDSPNTRRGTLPRAVVVTPVYKEELTGDDWRSIRSIRDHLADFHHFAVVPRRLERRCPGAFPPDRVVAFDDRYFVGPMTYNKLLFSAAFFAAFEKYEFMLLAQLDSLVLSDRLECWCGRGFDYIGAPWSEKYRNHSRIKEEKVGNGGFSLRNIKASLRVLRTKTSRLPDYTVGPKPVWWHWCRVRRIILFLGKVRALLPDITVEHFLKRHFLTNEDVFWGVYAKWFDPSFKVADEVSALHFAFETDPRDSLARAGSLPFGSHGWAKYDREFWEELLMAKPDDSPASGN
jgi:hypothetical protein